MTTTSPMPTSIDQVVDLLRQQLYVSDRRLAVAIFLALKLQRPLFLEGEAGVGKTEIARALAQGLDTELIRLQCYEGLDINHSVYEWNHTRQMLEIRMMEASGEVDRQAAASDLFSERFLIKRPLLQAIDESRERSPVLLIDELDRADEEFEGFLLELLADFQITIPELGAYRAAHPPVVIITSNRTREIHDALKRRCLYYWIDYPDFQKEMQIVTTKIPRCPPSVGPAGHRLYPGAARDRTVQDSRRFRDPGLDRSAAGAEPGCPGFGGHRRYPGDYAQVPGRHRVGAGRTGAGHVGTLPKPGATPGPARRRRRLGMS